MASTTVLGYAAPAVGRPLEPFRYTAPPLGEHEVRVSVTHCGLCYTDVHGIANDYGISTFPFVPGHEIVGTVSEVGHAVKGLQVGDRVGIGWQGRSCMRCEYCLQGDEQLCRDIDTCGVWTPYGGFATSVVADGRFAYRLPDSLPAEDAAVLMCAGISVYSPLKNHAAAGKRVGVVGVGGLGHLALQFTHQMGCEVTAISSSPGKEAEARSFGAHHFVLSGDKDALLRIRLSLDLLLYTSHAACDWTNLLYSLKTNGRLVLLGFPETPVTFEPLEMVVHQFTLTGSFIGNRAGMQEMLAFAGSHPIHPAVEVLPMSQVNEAIHRLKENKARYRIVLVNDLA